MRDRDAVNDAVQVIRQDYYQDVQGVAQDVAEYIRENAPIDRDRIMDVIHETIDGHGRVIYTFQAKLGLLASDNEDAYFEDFGSDTMPTESQKMYCAMERDVYEELDRMGIDINDDYPGQEEDDESDGE